MPNSFLNVPSTDETYNLSNPEGDHHRSPFRIRVLSSVARYCEMEVTKSKLSNLQIELLKLYANDISENSLLEIKQMLAKYFADRTSDLMDQFCARYDGLGQWT
jgi:hypothetical protein